MADNTQGTDTPGTAPETTPATTPVTVPDRPALEGLEQKYARTWREEGTFAFDEDTTREQVYSIDTPPPTVSGMKISRPK